MSNQRSPEFEAWVQRAKDADVYQVALECGARLTKASANEWNGPCLVCGGKDKFSVNNRKSVYMCRGSASNNGKDAGDVIAMVQHLQGMNFMEAVEFINKEPPPREDKDAPAREVDGARGRERREEQRDRVLTEKTLDEIRFDDLCEKSRTLWSYGVPISGTPAEKYLNRRGLFPTARMVEDLRFVDGLPYWGLRDKESERDEVLGDFPALIAAIRDVNMNIQGVHRIYIDPKSHGKLIPPGHREKNAAKKAFGNVLGGCVWLGPVSEAVACAEGIETALSYWQLGHYGDGTVCAAVTLGNLCGKATDAIKHPALPKRTVPNGEPDMSSIAIEFPAMVKEVLCLGDGDSEKIWTRQMLLMAMARLEKQGRRALCAFAPDGKDFNDTLLEQLQAEAS